MENPISHPAEHKDISSDRRDIREKVLDEKELQKDFFDSIGQRLKATGEILSDEEILDLVRKSAQETGFREKEPEEEKKKPLIFYRAMRKTEQVDKLLSEDEITIRPFSYTKPGKWSEKPTDIPLSYGENNPRLLRIIDLEKKWEDTAPYWGFGSEGSWSEAMNLDKVVLRKIDERELEVADIYKQIEVNVRVPEEKILQNTFIVDKIKTKEVQERQSLNEFINDAGFWREIMRIAEHFQPDGNVHEKKLNKKYLEYFAQTLLLDETTADTEEAKKSLGQAKIEIAKFIQRVQNLKQDDPNWSLEAKEAVLRSFPEETLRGAKEMLKNYIE